MGDIFKKYKRTIRTWLIKAIVSMITRLEVGSIPKLKRLLLKVFLVIFRKEMELAKELLPTEFQADKDRIVKGMAENQIMTLLEVFFYEKLLAADPDFVKMVGRDNLEKALSENKGLIILSAHFGNWELVGYALAKIGVPLHTMARAQAVDQMTKFMNGFREKRGIKMIMENLLPASIKLLRQNKCVGLLCDLNAKNNGYQVPFFGRTASFYSAVVLLGLRSKAPVIPCFAVRQPDGRQVVMFGKPIEFKRGDSMTNNIRRYVEVYESNFRQYPEQWCWFHNRYELVELGRVD